MTNSDDLADLRAEIRDLKRQIRELQTSTAQQSMSITKGRMRFIGGTLRVDSGGRVEIVGFFSIEGATEIIGPVTISGSIHATGEWTQIGPWHLNGDGSISGDVDLTGTLHLLSDLIVSAIGKITVQGPDGDTTLTNSRMDFANGGSVRADTTGVQLVKGNAQAAAFDNSARLRVGSRTLSVSTTGITANLPTATTATWPGRAAGDVVCTPSGDLYRIA